MDASSSSMDASSSSTDGSSSSSTDGSSSSSSDGGGSSADEKVALHLPDNVALLGLNAQGVQWQGDLQAGALYNMQGVMLESWSGKGSYRFQQSIPAGVYWLQLKGKQSFIQKVMIP